MTTKLSARSVSSPDVVGAGGDGALDACVEELLEGGEEGALQLNGQREHAG